MFFGLLQPGDTIMGMSLAEGGHLTHGMALNMSGKWFKVVSYGLDANGRDRLRRDGAPGPRAQAQADHRRRLGLRLRIDFERFAKVAKDVGAYLHGRHGALRRPDRRGRLPQPGAARRRRHLHHPQEPARPARRHHPDEDEAIAKKINSAIFPGIQGGPLMHVIAAKAVAFKEALAPEFKTYQQQVVKNAVVLAETLIERGLRIVSGRTESHVMLVDLRPKGITGKEAEARAAAGAHDLQQERHPERPGEADGHQRHPPRHAGDDHARLQGGARRGRPRT